MPEYKLNSAPVSCCVVDDTAVCFYVAIRLSCLQDTKEARKDHPWKAQANFGINTMFTLTAYY